MRLRLILCLLSLAVILALPLLAGPALAQPGPPGPPAVGVIKAKLQPVTETSEFVGRIQSIDRVDIVARVTAFIEERLFTEGAEVNKGDLLYRLERGPFEADLQSKQAAVQQYGALLRNATIVVGRAQSLLNTPAGQRSSLDDALAQQASQAAQALSAQAQLKNSQINLDYTEIKAPVGGKIGRTALTVGNVVTPSSGTLVSIVSQDPMYVLFPVAVRAAIELRNRYVDKGGLSAVIIKLKLPDGSMYGLPGHLDYVDPSVAANTDTLTLRARIPNPRLPGTKIGDVGDRALVNGEFVTVTVEGVEPVEALAIPRSAVLSDQQGNYVYVLGAENTVTQRRIQLGQSTPMLAMVSAGLTDGETVVVDGLQRIRPGIKVNPGPASGPPATPPGQPGGK